MAAPPLTRGAMHNPNCTILSTIRHTAKVVWEQIDIILMQIFTLVFQRLPGTQYGAFAETDQMAEYW